MLKKILILLIIFYIFTLIQTSFFIHFNEFLGRYKTCIPNLILISLILITFFENPQKKDSIILAFFGGFFLNLFSNQWPGLEIIILILIVFFIKKLLGILNKKSFLFFALIFVFSLFFYDLIISISDNIFKFYFDFKFISLKVCYSLIIGSIGYYALRKYGKIFEK